MKLKTFSFIILTAIPIFLFCQSDIQLPKAPPPPQLLSATEDLMQEHGILNRILLVYQELSRRINNRIPFPPKAIHEVVTITRDFIENFHVYLEDQYVFPYFIKAHVQEAVIKELIAQHVNGKKITDFLLVHSMPEEITNEIQAMIVAGYLDIYVRMFRPHEARESSELFPNFSSLMPTDEYIKLGKLFETIGNDKFGKSGYNNIIAQLTEIERQLGLYSLSQIIQ